MYSCCICETDKFSKPYRIVDGFELSRCYKCGIVYLNERVEPTQFLDDARDDFYLENKKVEYWSFPELYEKYRDIFEDFYSERLSRIIHYRPNAKSMFDIGAGYGFWMKYCKEQGLEVCGIDINEEMVNYGREIFKLDISKAALLDYKFDREYEIYDFCDVLEHLEDPNKELRCLHEVMSSESVLFIQVPDVLGFRIPYGHNLGLPHHLWQFNFQSLRKLLTKNGFRVLVRWHGILGVIGYYEGNKINPFVELKWNLAKRLKIGNRLMVLCEKAVKKPG